MSELRNGWVIVRDGAADAERPWWDGEGWTTKQNAAVYFATETDALRVADRVLTGIATQVVWTADRRLED